MLMIAHFLTLLILQTYCLQGLNENQRRYLRKCPNQNTSSPCLPDNIDSFLTSKLNKAWDLQNLFTKVYIPGVCYHKHTKFCPRKLLSCKHKDNLGHMYSLTGACIQKFRDCPEFSSAEICSDLRCPNHQYLCHPKGCINLSEPCNGLCLPVELPSTLYTSTRSTSSSTTSSTTSTSTSTSRQPSPTSPTTSTLNSSPIYSSPSRLSTESTKLSTLSTKLSTLSTPFKYYSSIVNSTLSLFQGEFPLSRERYLCGDFCISRHESTKFYDCQGSCQSKTVPCLSEGNGSPLCPQHFTLCGKNTCLDRFAVSLVEAETGYPSHYSCQGNCTTMSTPCLNNGTMECQDGYWLCENQMQCILRFIGREAMLSQICDGYAECSDSSDESLVQCAKVYAVELSILVFLLLSVVPITVVSILLYRQSLCTIRVECIKFRGLTSKQRSLSTEKGYEGNEDEMHLRSLAPEDVD